VIDIERELEPNLSRYFDLILTGSIYGPGRALPSVVDQAPNLRLPVLTLQPSQRSIRRR
jgi:hypothetical protein